VRGSASAEWNVPRGSRGGRFCAHHTTRTRQRTRRRGQGYYCRVQSLFELTNSKPTKLALKAVPSEQRGVLLQDLEDGALEGVKAVRKVEESARREESGSREREGGSGSFTLYPTALYSFKVVDSGFFLRGACLEGLAEPTPKELCLRNTFGEGRIDWCLFSEPGSAI
jgi:hypothetical protein